jgi:hypothetical protein
VALEGTAGSATRNSLQMVSAQKGFAVDATTVLVTASSGPDDIEAPLVNDPTGGLPNAFLGTITPGAEDTARYGFAIPFSSLNRVRVSVDLGDGTHEPVTFAGAVEREQ